ncbi:hypothetical protein C8K63_109236 [Pseudomonas sp. GV085]|nr:hypothetical protein C8K63_109236 [Pseudomonas sp. GV085]
MCSVLDLFVARVAVATLIVRFRPILLKKAARVCVSEKYASEVEIFTFGRVFQTRISRSSVQKRRYHQSMIRQFWQSDFFNRIGQEQPVEGAMEHD